MYVVHFFANKNLLLTQYRSGIPAVNEELKIKGRKGKVTNVTAIDEKNVHVLLELEVIKAKSKFVVDNKKSRRR